uniref:Uncharacterized protein n=1 Tax=Strongyloides venezuelensis TaxID=75913 RepID=A0A0K0EWY1_STRVS
MLINILFANKSAKKIIYVVGLFFLIINVIKCELSDYFNIFELKEDKTVGKRIKNISSEKFSHIYYVSIDGSIQEKDKRNKRDLGIISGPVAVALVSGVIGFTTNALQDLTSYEPVTSTGGCKWFGTAPLCNYRCPIEYDFIREHNGRCSKWWLSGFCEPDPSYGMPCTTIFGGYYTKRFCCKSDAKDCSWSGRWISALTANNAHCRYDHNAGVCGRLSCGINNSQKNAYGSTNIEGDGCDMLNLFNVSGKATCGYIAWYNIETGEYVDAWYKSTN